MAIKRYKAGTSIVFTVEVRDATDALIDPDTVTITILEPDGSTKQVDAASMTQDSTGVYSYNWQSESADTTGFYSWYVESTRSGKTAVEYDATAFELY